MNRATITLLNNVDYIYDLDLWFYPIDIQFEIICYWESKIDKYNNKLYYINPKIVSS